MQYRVHVSEKKKKEKEEKSIESIYQEDERTQTLHF